MFPPLMQAKTFELWFQNNKLWFKNGILFQALEAPCFISAVT